MLDLQFGLDKQLFGKINAIEPSAINYLAECYSRAEEELKPSMRKRGRESDEDYDAFSKTKEKIIKDCQHAIVSKARFV